MHSSLSPFAYVYNIRIIQIEIGKYVLCIHLCIGLFVIKFLVTSTVWLFDVITNTSVWLTDWLTCLEWLRDLSTDILVDGRTEPLSLSLTDTFNDCFTDYLTDRLTESLSYPENGFLEMDILCRICSWKLLIIDVYGISTGIHYLPLYLPRSIILAPVFHVHTHSNAWILDRPLIIGYIITDLTSAPEIASTVSL
jgi:hypothetical protein